ncbi:methionyl-tRNA formyltransferase [Dietzia timorensis]|uniref:Methionyl-tRNA formyltransferase n=1 Tax=Dietzia timorensis TaxID=499555 RepID=A0A173LPI6_9ACTN|nr:methionyl-tRNA formyltransferase [Dietzia timorensis]ANI92490.1 Methionyl-tRNA formyltransferase [Dietzia timorensis]
MRIVFAGTPETAVPSLKALIDSDGHEIAAVITRPDAPKGRGRTLHRSPVGEVADAAGIEVLTPTSGRDPELASALRELDVEAAAVVAYGNILPQDVLDIPRHGWVNLHFSLLPAWRGASPVNAAIAAGDEITGASTFRLEAAMDTGPVYGTITETIGAQDTAGELLERLAESGAGLLVATLNGIESGELVAVEQPSDGVSYSGKISSADARIRWDLPAFAVDRHIRSITPVPGAWTELDGQRFKIGAVTLPGGDSLPEQAAGLTAGELNWTKKSLFVGTASGPIVIDRLQPPGKKLMNAMDWVRGSHIEPGARFA